jgi:phage terminase large subunit
MSKLAATYYHVRKSKARIQVHQGGSRSGKTFSILTALIELCHKNTGTRYHDMPKDIPSPSSHSDERLLRDTQQRRSVQRRASQQERRHLSAMGQPRGVYIGRPTAKGQRTEAGDTLHKRSQRTQPRRLAAIMLRTTDRVIIDFNPSDEFHWIYEQVIPREDADFFQTTYKDNPFLPESVVMEIERFKDVDENFWRVYGLGERGTSQATIFTHWKEIDQIPNEYKLLTTGLDFGYTNDPTAVVRIYTDGHGFAVDEICYATRLTNSDIAKMLRDNGVHRSDVVICDSAEPKSIDEIHAHGFNTHGARKGRDSIRSGISFLHSRPLAVTSRSVNLIRELRNYKWKEDKNGKQLNEPVDSFNHAIDAMRYGITWNQTNPNFGSYAIG